MEFTHHDPDEFLKWVRRIERAELAKILRRTCMLGALGADLGMPTVRQLAGSRIRELRSGKYRLYFVIDGDTIHFLTYGEKDTQTRDIKRAQERLT